MVLLLDMNFLFAPRDQSSSFTFLQCITTVSFFFLTGAARTLAPNTLLISNDSCIHSDSFTAKEGLELPLYQNVPTRTSVFLQRQHALRYLLAQWHSLALAFSPSVPTAGTFTRPTVGKWLSRGPSRSLRMFRTGTTKQRLHTTPRSTWRRRPCGLERDGRSW